MGKEPKLELEFEVIDPADQPEFYDWLNNGDISFGDLDIEVEDLMSMAFYAGLKLGKSTGSA